MGPDSFKLQACQEILDQGGSDGWNGCSSKGLFIEASFHQSGFSSKWLFIIAAFHQSGFSSKRLFIEAAIHRSGVSSNADWGGFSSNLCISGSFIKIVGLDSFFQ
jgi:hypothetical protein